MQVNDDSSPYASKQIMDIMISSKSKHQVMSVLYGMIEVSNYSGVLGLCEQDCKTITQGLVQFMPQNRAFLKALAISKLNMNEVDESLEIFERIIETGENDPNIEMNSVYFYYGTALFKKGNKKDAVKFFDIALNLKEDAYLENVISLYKKMHDL